MKATINLNQKEILDIIAEHLLRKGIKASGDLRFEVRDFCRKGESGFDISLTIPVEVGNQNLRQVETSRQFGDR